MNRSKDEYYLRAVTELGDTRKIIANQDIHARNGMLLVASGVSITSKLYERLVQHVLLKPLDMSLSAEAMVNPETIWNDLQELVRQNPKLERMIDILNQGVSLQQTVHAIPIPAPLAFKLTVAREKFPAIYRHSLLILVISLYLARCDRMYPADEACLATAALFHDIGLMHISPLLLDPGHVMNSEERRHLYTHPLMAYLLLREFPELSGSIADAVLEHHESLDGRGYPRGLSGSKISRHGQILAVAEVSARAYESGTAAWTRQKLEVVLKLNARQYGSGLIGYLKSVWDSNDAEADTVDHDEIVSQVVLIAKLFEEFDRHADVGRGNMIYDFAQTRFSELRVSLLDAGFNPNDPEELIQRFADDPGCMAEFAPLLEETLWQIRSIVRDIPQRWPDKIDGVISQTRKEEYAWISMMELLLMSA
ncbi:MAG: HD domain-containing protein [Nitrosomonadales bacterium]|nr:HD domain-containing protein [Nitrosomonadales bacterium]